MELSVNKDPRISMGYPFKPDDMPEMPEPLQSYLATDLLNGDGAKYGTAYIFFPLTEGYLTGDPDAFRWTPETDDLWRQTLVHECESLEAAVLYRDTFQSDLA